MFYHLTAFPPNPYTSEASQRSFTQKSHPETSLKNLTQFCCAHEVITSDITAVFSGVRTVLNANILKLNLSLWNVQTTTKTHYPPVNFTSILPPGSLGMLVAVKGVIKWNLISLQKIKIQKGFYINSGIGKLKNKVQTLWKRLWKRFHQSDMESSRQHKKKDDYISMWFLYDIMTLKSPPVHSPCEHIIGIFPWWSATQSAGAVEYTDCILAEG